MDDVERAAGRVAALVLAADALARRCDDAERLERLQWAADAGRARLLELATGEPERPVS